MGKVKSLSDWQKEGAVILHPNATQFRFLQTVLENKADFRGKNGVAYQSGFRATFNGGKQVIDRLKLRMKPLSLLYQKMYMARFARTGSTLVASGVPLLQMLEITSSAINNVYITESINRAITQVKAGKSLADALDGDPNFLELVPNMLRIGEQSGSIEGMLAKTADYYEKELDEQVKAISTIIEPVLMVTLGIVALVIVSAVLLPVYSLAGKNIGG
jgi:type IV pilus assembly protein PilC